MTADRIKPAGPKMDKAEGPYSRRVNIPKTDTEGSTVAPVNTRKTRGQFRVIEFTRAIQQHGYFLTWRKSVVCPCVSSTTSQVAMNCAHCDGSGYFFFDPIGIRGVMSSFDRNQKIYEKFGAWVEGSSSLTVEPQHRISYGDQIEMRDSIASHTEWITTGNRGGSRRVLPANVDCARYRILRMTAALMAVGEDIQALQEGIHYELTPEGWIKWLDADLQVAGQTVSVIYEYHPIYLVTSHPHMLRDGTLENKNPVIEVVALPIQAMVKLDFLMDIAKTPPALMAPLPNGKDPEVPTIKGSVGC